MGIRSGFICWHTALFAPLLQLVRRFESSVASLQDEVWERARPYSAVPGPKPLPIVGNTWRFLPFIGKMCDSVTIPQLPLDFTKIVIALYFFLFFCGAATQRGSWPPHS